MNYDLIVFSGGYGYAQKRLEEEAKKKKLDILLAQYRNLSSTVSNDKFSVNLNGEPLPPAKSVFLRALGEDTDYNALKNYILDFYKGLGVHVLNYKSYDKWVSLDKTTQYLELQKAGIPIVESFFFGSKEKMLDWAKKEKMPIIVKENVGSLGLAVFKINSVKELEELLANYSLISVKTLFVQRFLPGGEDLRVIVLGGKVIGAMKRIAKEGTHLTNYSQGGNVAKYDVDQDFEAVNIALKVAKTFDLDYCGVDLMKDEEGGWSVLEVNRACQFEGFEKATGLNVAEKVLDFLVK